MSAPAPPHYTSVPAWTREPHVDLADLAGRTHTVLQIGADPKSAAVVGGWLAELGDRPTSYHRCPDAAAAAAALDADLATARVGHRVLVAGTADACLAVRAAAVRAGLSDDEVRFGVVSVEERTVWCVHCAVTTSAAVELDDVVACGGCGRRLVVYPHVSRRTGQHLGFMIDAEAAT